MHANAMYSLQIEKFYGAKSPERLKTYEDLDEVYGVDFTIEDAKANVNIRLAQSIFRKAVLDNFGGKCCISGIAESPLLVASHIIPWSANKNYRSDPSNGLCLYVEYDAFFDKGYITLDQDLRIVVTEYIDELSTDLRTRLTQLSGISISIPTMFKIKPEHIDYHRNNVFMRRI